MTGYPWLPARHVLRLAASYEMLPRDQCTAPDRCQERQCQICGQAVHYDPKASIPILGPEFIICDQCQERLL